MSEPIFHLILIGKPLQLDMQDFEEIAGHIRRKAPDIEPFVVADTLQVPDPALTARMTSRPSLLFAPIAPEYFRPSGGKHYYGCAVPKLEQMEMFKRLNLPVPRWAIIKPGIKLDPGVWGDLVVVKPVIGSRSDGVELRMTSDIAYRLPQSYPAKHPGRRSPMMAQVFVDPGPEAARIRVLTLFGEPLYAEEIKIPAVDRPAVLTAEVLGSIPIVTTRSKVRHRAFVYDADVLDLARQASRILPDVPLKACDLIRDWKTGRLSILEVNPGGNTWHFSSRGGQRESVDGQKRQEQFNAFELAADLLIDRTRKEAR